MSDLGGRLASLLDVIYSAAEEPERWPGAIETLAQAFTSHSAGVVVQNAATREFPLVAVNAHAQEITRDYVAYYGARDPLREVGARRVGEILTESMIVTPFVAMSETYNDFYRRGGMERFLSYGWNRAENELASLVFYRSQRDAAFDADEEKLFSMLVPHVRRAVKMTLTLQGAASESACLSDAFDQIAHAVIITDEQARIRAINAAARQLLRRGDALRVVDGRLTATRSADDALLRRLLTSAAERSPQARSHVLISRRDGAPATTVAAVPLSTGRLGRRVMLLCTEDVVKMGPEELMRAFAVTRSEAEVALRLATGAGLDDIAEERGSSPHTVRTQLKHLLRKTGTRSQADLIRVLLSSPLAQLRRR